MEKKFKKSKSQKLQNKITLQIIRENIKKLSAESENINNNKSNIKLPELNEIIESLYQNVKNKKFYIIKYKKFFNLITNKKIKIKNNNNKEKEKILEESLIHISIYILKDYINNDNHKYIQEYLKLLLIFISNNILKIESFILILDIILKSIIDFLNKINISNSFQLYKINNEPLLFINDILESIINFPINIIKNQKFIDEIIILFNKFLNLSKQKNIFIERDVHWLKIFENQKIDNNENLELYADKPDKQPIDKIIDFLICIYKNHIPKCFYNEIFKKSAIDLPYFLNIVKFMKSLFQDEIKLNKEKEFKIKNGLYFFGNKIIIKDYNFKPEEFSLIFSFKISKIINEDEIILFNLLHNDNNSIISVLINKERKLVIKSNKDTWNTNLLIDKDKCYMLCITRNKKNKEVILFINIDGNNSKNGKNQRGKKLFFTECCFKYNSKKMNFPRFLENMNIQLGNENFYGILGEILLINKELVDNDKNLIDHLFNTKEFYANLICKRNLNDNLINNISLFSKNYKYSIDVFKKIEYEILLFISPNSFYSNNIFNEQDKIYKYKSTLSIELFLNEKGIEFLIFMLYNIDSQIKDNKIFSLYLYKTIDFLYDIIIKIDKIKDKIINDEFATYLEFDEKNYFKQINIFFLSLFSILKDNQINNNKNISFRVLSKDVRRSLINFFVLNIDSYNSHKNLILNLLLDFELFNQREYISELNEIILDKMEDLCLNEEIIYKILLLDFIFELKNIKHKKYSNFIKSLINLEDNKFICSQLVNYLSKINSEAKIYHYLIIIYLNMKYFKKILEEEEKFILFSFVQKKFDTLNHEHCKYCSYILILCFLIKDEIWNNNEENLDADFSYTNFGYTACPSFLFIRCIFIQNFKLNNDEKFAFIKLKNKNLWDMDFFESINKNPLDLIDKKTFIKRFSNIIKYSNFLFDKREKYQKINNLLEKYYNFIIDFLHKIKNENNVQTNNKNNKKNFLNDLFKSKEIINFFISYIKFDKEKALKIIEDYIKTSISRNFIFKLISPDTKFENKKDSQSIKIEIIKNIILEIIKKKEIKKNKDYIFILLILIYKNIFEEKIEVTKEFPTIFVSYYIFISDNEFFLDKHPLNLNYPNKENMVQTDNIYNKYNIKFISEIIIDIIFHFFFNGKFNNILMIESFFIKENSSSVFYNKDVENIKKHKKNSSEEINPSIFMNEINNLIFCLYFLIIFFEKTDLCKTQVQKNIIEKIKGILFNDFNKLYKNYSKNNIKLKKIENYGKKFDIYNKMLNFYSKKFKEKEFNVNIFYKQYIDIIKSDNNKVNALNIEGVNNNEEILENNKKNRISTKKNNIERSKSFEKQISYFMKIKYLKRDNYIRSFTSVYEEKNNNIILNQSMNITGVIDFRDKNEKKISYNIIKNDLEGEVYLKKELSKINILNIYYEIIIKNLGSQDIIKMLFNPKEYFLWKNFTIIFKDYIFYNKKFKKISKIFQIHTRKISVVYSSEKDKEFFLNYPTKIKNYIIDDYYRPFLKPFLNFFNNKYIKKSHNFMKEKILKNPQFKEDNFNLIKFRRIIPNVINANNKIKCEKIQNKGNVFGYITFLKDFMIFINSPEDDERNSKDLEKCLQYIYSIKEDSTIDHNKYILMFYNDIKELIKRRMCLNYVAYEIFMKNNRSYFFNFFNTEAINLFFEEFKKYTSDKSKVSKIHNINEGDNKNNENDLQTNNSNNNIDISSSNIKEKDYIIIDEPINTFEKMQYKNKYKKGEISNFNYLLLLNKYSSRTYNDYNQYLIFPLLFMDENGKKKRDLSKAICLNKEDDGDSLNKAISNKELLGYYFNQHYSTGGFILYYLVRLIPFTYSQIIFQSGKFDLPARLFSSIKNFLFFLTITQDNRELCPEFYFNYEFLLNLNYNDFGILETDREHYHLNNVDSSGNKIFAQFIIDLRKLLEELDLSPWIDNIFGSKQLNDSDDQPNSFPSCSYESECDFEKIKKNSIPLNQKISEIQQKIDILKFGVIPAKIFNKPHQKVNKHNIESDDEVNIFEKNQSKIIELINDHIKKKSSEEFYYINGSNSEIELIFKYRRRIDIFKLKIKEIKIIEKSFDTKEQIDIKPYNNLFCEIVSGIYCFVRNIDNTIHFITIKKKSFEYQWTCIVTAIVPFIQNKKNEDKNIKKAFIGDERGNLHLMEIEYYFNEKDKSYEIKNVSIKKSIKAHSSLIKGIIHNERLNIIISWSDEGVISINNDYSLNFLNIIDLGSNYDIKEILICKYDLMCVSCDILILNIKKYKIICFTLNGVQVTYCEDNGNIIRCLIDEKLNIIHSNGNIFSHNFYDFYQPINNQYSDYIDKNEGEKIIVEHCNYFPKIKKLLMIYSDKKISFQSLDKNFI